ncbi:hypothetical protein FHU30_008527 [Actinomadura rupiterrae]|nr:hypothetical protein [Actinomadura rupiterrae]MCP2343133.1 hypothetical protein [Actinomadura rupiterrae]
MLDVPLWLWAAFAATVIIALTVDLLAHRGAHIIGFREAAVWSGLWVGLALIFAVVVYAVLGATAATEYTTAWLLEKSLSVDNLFVFALIFAYFKVPRAYQHRVLFFGIFGALVFRGIFLALGVAVVSRFTMVLFVFAAVLFYSTYKILKHDQSSFDPGTSVAVRLLRKLIPVQNEYTGTRSSSGRPDGAWRPHCWPLWSRSRLPTWSSPSTASRPYWRSATTPSSSTPATPSPSWACARCTSCSPGCWTASTTSAKDWRSSWPSSASNSSSRPPTRPSTPAFQRSPPWSAGRSSSPS